MKNNKEGEQSMMKKLIDRIQEVNQLIYNTKNKGRDFWGDKWNEPFKFLEDVPVWAMYDFRIYKGVAEAYLKFADSEDYWYRLEKDLRYKEVESQGYASRMKEYFKQYLPSIWKADYQTLREGAFIVDLLDDGYISQEEADDYCKLLADVQHKALNDAKRAYKIILGITDQKVEAEIQTPTFDFLCKGIDSRLKNKFISFCSNRLHNNIELDDTNKVLILKTLVGNNIKEKLRANKRQMKGLWLELKQLNVISQAISTDTLNKASRNTSQVKPEILNAWNDYLKKMNIINN